MLKSTKMSLVGGAVLVAVAFAGARVYAGRKVTQGVTVNTASRYAYGSLGSTRNSANTVEDIGCYTNQAGVTGCSATNSANVTVGCATTDPAFRSAVNSINGDSRIYFEYAAGTGTCTALQVENYSVWAPKAL